MIGVPGIQFKKNRNAFPRHRGSWTSTNEKMNRNALNMSIFRIGPPKNSLNVVPFLEKKFRLVEISLGRLMFPIFFFKYGPFYKAGARDYRP